MRHLVDDVSTGEEDVVAAANCLENSGSVDFHCASCQDGQQGLRREGERKRIV